LEYESYDLFDFDGEENGLGCDPYELLGEL
jgi:hypothetical protein